jgi:hypothetical protein
VLGGLPYPAGQRFTELHSVGQHGTCARTDRWATGTEEAGSSRTHCGEIMSSPWMGLLGAGGDEQKCTDGAHVKRFMSSFIRKSCWSVDMNRKSKGKRRILHDVPGSGGIVSPMVHTTEDRTTSCSSLIFLDN